MITVEMPDDIRKFEPKFIGPLTMRQTVCLTIGAAIAIPISMLVPVSIMYKFIIAVCLAMPFLFAGWYKPMGMNFEVYAMRMIYYRFLTPRLRKTKAKNAYRLSYEKVKRAEERKKLAAMSEAQRKAYQKQKENKTIQRSRKNKYHVFT